MKTLKLVIYITLIITASVNCTGSDVRRARYQQYKDAEDAYKIKRRKKIKKERRERPYVSTDKNIIQMKNENGIYKIPVYVNDVEMYFIFDTGASLISISETEANFLVKKGTITRDDILGTSEFSDANGDISEGTIINLKKVKIGNRVLSNVEASVVHNSAAPLLLGQSALQKFGKVSIDYNEGTITFE